MIFSVQAAEIPKQIVKFQIWWNLDQNCNNKKTNVENKAPLSQIKVLPFKEKKEWTLSAKYNIGKKVEDKKEDGENGSTKV